MLHIAHLVEQGQSHRRRKTPALPQHANAKPPDAEPQPSTARTQQASAAAEQPSKRHKPAQRDTATEATPYAILRAQSNLQQLIPTLVGDQIPLATEAFQLLQSWTASLWGEPIRLTEQSDLEDTVPWDPPAAEQKMAGDDDENHDLWRPADAVTGDRAGPAGMESWDTAEIHGADTEEEAWGLTRRRRRNAATAADTPSPRATRSGRPSTERRPPDWAIKASKASSH